MIPGLTEVGHATQPTGIPESRSRDGRAGLADLAPKGRTSIRWEMSFALKQDSITNANSSCIGCGICVSVCPMDTLSFGPGAGRGRLVQIQPQTTSKAGRPLVTNV
jgi:ferredoxin